jgi:peptidoglycan hydrolase CwlO-like protein
MSIGKLEEQKDELLDKIEALEEKCDTLPICEEDDGCERCKTYAEIESLSEEVEELENKIEEILGSEEED